MVRHRLGCLYRAGIERISHAAATGADENLSLAETSIMSRHNSPGKLDLTHNSQFVPRTEGLSVYSQTGPWASTTRKLQPLQVTQYPTAIKLNRSSI